MRNVFLILLVLCLFANSVHSQEGGSDWYDGTWAHSVKNHVVEFMYDGGIVSPPFVYTESALLGCSCDMNVWRNNFPMASGYSHARDLLLSVGAGNGEGAIFFGNGPSNGLAPDSVSTSVITPVEALLVLRRLNTTTGVMEYRRKIVKSSAVPIIITTRLVGAKHTFSFKVPHGAQ